jgi:ribosome recycling factor
MNAREEHLKKIREAKEQLKTAGPHHRRDLMKYIHRLQKEVMIYDKYRQAASVAN